MIGAFSELQLVQGGRGLFIFDQIMAGRAAQEAQHWSRVRKRGPCRRDSG
jgi:hypothetical protein